MRLQTRLFLITATLVLALMAVQYLVHLRQLRDLEREIGEVATSVGENLIRRTVWYVPAGECPDELEAAIEEEVGHPRTARPADVHVVAVAASDARARVVGGAGEGPPRTPCASGEADTLLRTGGTWAWRRAGSGGAGGPEDDGLSAGMHGLVMRGVADPDGRVRIKVETVVGESDHILVITDESGEEERIPIPVSPTVRVVRRTMGQGLVASGALLLLGLTAAGVLSSRVTRPIRRLVSGAEAVGRGELGVQVPAISAGEVGELERAFNEMSLRLEELEGERLRWQAREHLVQLGDLARGLGHTLRNPLNTLGLAVEELASGEARDSHRLVALARGQIRRIDRWLRSFLALGAGGEATSEAVDLGGLVQSAVLEAVQQGARLRTVVPEPRVTVRAVPGALSAALSNLIENAVDASPEGREVTVSVGVEHGEAVIRVEDQGEGLPEEVRDRLYSPHLTTKVGGSGMGLFLARQLVVGMHGGRLELADREGGGTVATVRLPIDPVEGVGAR